MEKNLPKVYANPINKVLTNNKDIFYSTNIKERKETRSINDINREINSIFASSNHVYKSKVRIKTSTEEFDTIIVGRTKNYLLTLKGEKITITSIEDIKRL